MGYTAAMSPLGMAIAGPVAGAFGVHSWFIVGGAAYMLMGIAGFVMPAIMQIENNHRQHKAPEEKALVPVPVQVSVESG